MLWTRTSGSELYTVPMCAGAPLPIPPCFCPSDPRELCGLVAFTRPVNLTAPRDSAEICLPETMRQRTEVRGEDGVPRVDQQQRVDCGRWVRGSEGARITPKPTDGATAPHLTSPSPPADHLPGSIRGLHTIPGLRTSSPSLFPHNIPCALISSTIPCFKSE